MFTIDPALWPIFTTKDIHTAFFPKHSHIGLSQIGAESNSLSDTFSTHNMYMYMCMYAYMYMCMYVRVHVHIYLCCFMYLRMSLCVGQLF